MQQEDRGLAISREWAIAQTQKGLTPQERKQHNALVAAELYKLRIAYPAQARNFKPEEVAATNALWVEIFEGVEPQVLHEAVKRFITTDRKGFFPAPGQVAGFVEQIMKEREAAREMRRNHKRAFKILEKQEEPECQHLRIEG